MTRKAETKDIPFILNMFLLLINHLRSLGSFDPFSRDPNQLVGGVMELIIARMNTNGHIVLVMEDDHGKCTGFLVGGILPLPNLYKHNLLGEIQWMYPLSFEAKPLVDEFDDWALEHDASARSCLCFADNQAAVAVFQRGGMELNYFHFMKPYDEA